MPVPVAVREFIERSGQSYEAFEHRRAFTAQEEAAVTHTPGRQWAKTVVCLLDDEVVLVVLPADRLVDVERLRQFAGSRLARLATEGEFAWLYPGCELGAMPPFGPLYKQRVFVDRSLTRASDVVFHAGTHADGIRMSYAALAEVVRPIVGDFAAHV